MSTTEADLAAAVPHKPRLRGWIHAAALAVVVPAGLALVAHARPGEARITASLYVLGLVGLFASSAFYHLIATSDRAVLWARKADHAAIFVLIAAGATLFVVLAVNPSYRYVVVGAIWFVSLSGVAFKVATLGHFNSIGSWLYQVSWAGILLVPVFQREFGWGVVALLFLSGVLFSGGAVTLLTKRPNPVPDVFGYHEVWHSLVVLATACVYVAVWSVTGP